MTKLLTLLLLMPLLAYAQQPPLPVQIPIPMPPHEVPGMGDNCRITHECKTSSGPMARVECGFTDGALIHYTNMSEVTEPKGKAKIIATCGTSVCKPGVKVEYCAKNCPPTAWTCPLPDNAPEKQPLSKQK